jgi:hypothetical protein
MIFLQDFRSCAKPSDKDMVPEFRASASISGSAADDGVVELTKIVTVFSKGMGNAGNLQSNFNFGSNDSFRDIAIDESA